MKDLINVTEITEYLFCKRKLYLKLVKNLREPPNEKMILGFLKHKVFELYSNDEKNCISSIKKNLSLEELKNLFIDNLKRLALNVYSDNIERAREFHISQSRFYNEVILFFSREIDIRLKGIKELLDKGIYGEMLWNSLTPKYLSEFEIISQKYKIKGRVDRIEMSDKIIPYEIKTRDKMYDSDKIQLAAYALLLEDKFSSNIDHGYVELQNSKEKVDITEELKKQVLEIADNIRQMESSEAPFNNNFSKCKFCSFEKQCFEL